jgi:general secretion pathway protein K
MKPGWWSASLNCRNKPSDQQGATLVIVLVVVLMVALLATRMSGEYLLLSRTLENQMQLQQARTWLRSTESLAREALLADLASGSVADSELELWGRPLRLALPQGQLTACLTDLQGRLNLNDLDGAAQSGYTVAQKRFIRLLQVVAPNEGIDQVVATSLANAVFDWVDADSQPRYPGGAEFTDYLQDAAAGRPANQPFADLSELLLVRGMTPELVAALTPWLSVWGNGSMNLNTIDSQLVSAMSPMARGVVDEGPEPVLLRTLQNAESLLPLSEQAAAEIVAQRRSRGGMLEDFNLFGQGMLALQQWELEGLDLDSEYFLLRANVHMADRDFGLETVLQRAFDPAGRPGIRLRSRTFSNGFAADTTGASGCVAALP